MKTNSTHLGNKVRPMTQKVVLLVEDNSINQQVAKELLVSMQLSVVIANNGLEAIEAINIKRFDLILMDLQMPKMDGFKATIAIRKLTQFNDLPIIAMTAHTRSGDKEKCLLVGMNDHLAKPIDPDNLTQILTKWLATDPLSSHNTLVSDSMDSRFVDDALSGINQLEGLKKINNNHSLYFKLLREFQEDHGKTASNIQKALKQGDIVYAQHLTHKIKGVAGNLGANNLLNSATQLEKALIEKINDKELLILFVKDFEIVMDALTKINCVETINPQQSKNNTIDIQQVNQCIKLLKSDLEKHCFQSSENLMLLNKALGNHHAEIYHRLEKSIDKFLFEPALEYLDKLNIKISENIR